MWTVIVWDGFSRQEFVRTGSYAQVSNSLAGLPASHIWAIKPA